MRAITRFVSVLLPSFVAVLSVQAQSAELDELVARDCQLGGTIESFFPGDQNFAPRVKVPYLVLQCEDGTIHACTVAVQTTLDQWREVGLISNFCFAVSSEGNL